MDKLVQAITLLNPVTERYLCGCVEVEFRVHQHVFTFSELRLYYSCRISICYFKELEVRRDLSLDKSTECLFGIYDHNGEIYGIQQIGSN